MWEQPSRWSIQRRNMAPIAFLASVFGLTGKSKRNLINVVKKSSWQEALVNELLSYVFSPLREGDISLFCRIMPLMRRRSAT